MNCQAFFCIFTSFFTVFTPFLFLFSFPMSSLFFTDFLRTFYALYAFSSPFFLSNESVQPRPTFFLRTFYGFYAFSSPFFLSNESVQPFFTHFLRPFYGFYAFLVCPFQWKCKVFFRIFLRTFYAFYAFLVCPFQWKCKVFFYAFCIVFFYGLRLLVWIADLRALLRLVDIVYIFSHALVLRLFIFFFAIFHHAFLDAFFSLLTLSLRTLYAIKAGWLIYGLDCANLTLSTSTLTLCFTFIYDFFLLFLMPFFNAFFYAFFTPSLRLLYRFLSELVTACVWMAQLRALLLFFDIVYIFFLRFCDGLSYALFTLFLRALYAVKAVGLCLFGRFTGFMAPF